MEKTHWAWGRRRVSDFGACRRKWRSASRRRKGTGPLHENATRNSLGTRGTADPGETGLEQSAVEISQNGSVVEVFPETEATLEFLGMRPSNICFGGPKRRTAYVTEVTSTRLVSFLGVVRTNLIKDGLVAVVNLMTEALSCFLGCGSKLSPNCCCLADCIGRNPTRHVLVCFS